MLIPHKAYLPHDKICQRSNPLKDGRAADELVGGVTAYQDDDQ